MKCAMSRVIAAMLVAGSFCAAAAEGLSSEEKIGIIDEIVKTKLKEAKGGDAKSDVLDAVAAKFPLDPDEKAPGYIAFIKKLEEQTRKKYPITDKELEKEYRASAEMEYPIYNIRDNVTVVFLLVGKPFTVTGTYYRQDSTFVWVGSHKIPRRNLEKEYALRFDSDQVNQLRWNYVKENVRRYQQERNSYLENLRRRSTDQMHILRGDIKYENKWSTARAIVLQKYSSAVERQDKLIADAIQKARDCTDYNEKYKILEAVIQQYPNYRSLSSIENLLQEMKGEYKRKQEIRQEMQGIWAFSFSGERPKWQSIIKSHFAVEQALDKARELQRQESYDLAIAEVEKIISQEPRISEAAGAQDLLKTLVNQREEERQKQRMLAESRAAVQQIRFNDSNQTAQIIVRKQINVGKKWNLWIVPMELKQEIEELQQTMYNMNKELLSSKRYEVLKNKADTDSQLHEANMASAQQFVDNTKQGMEYSRLCYEAKKQCNRYKITARNTIIQLGKNEHISWFEARSQFCSLSNVHSSVILFAWEEFYDGSFGSTLLRSWFMEYTPTSQTVNWDLE